MSEIKLKPCPFCGGEATLINTTTLGMECKSVMCMKCKAKVNNFEGSNTATKACEAWNRRKDEDVVRCKDCIYREQADGDYGDCYYCALTKCDVGENDYCGQGERSKK